MGIVIQITINVGCARACMRIFNVTDIIFTTFIIKSNKNTLFPIYQFCSVHSTTALQDQLLQEIHHSTHVCQLFVLHSPTYTQVNTETWWDREAIMEIVWNHHKFYLTLILHTKLTWPPQILIICLPCLAVCSSPSQVIRQVKQVGHLVPLSR